MSAPILRKPSVDFVDIENPSFVWDFLLYDAYSPCCA